MKDLQMQQPGNSTIAGRGMSSGADWIWSWEWRTQWGWAFSCRRNGVRLAALVRLVRLDLAGRGLGPIRNWNWRSPMFRIFAHWGISIPVKRRRAAQQSCARPAFVQNTGWIGARANRF